MELIKNLCKRIAYGINWRIADDIIKNSKGWMPVAIEPKKEGSYTVWYKHGKPGELSWWRGYWANGNVDVSEHITHWIDKPKSEQIEH